MKYNRERHSVHQYKFNPVAEGTAVFAVSLVSLFLVIYFIVHHAEEAQKGEIKDGLLRTVKILSSHVDIESHKKLKNPEQQNSPLYKKTLEPLKQGKIAGGDEIEFIYTCIQKDTEKEKSIHFILDAAKQGDHDGDGLEDKSFVMDPYDDAPLELALALKTGLPTFSDEPYTDQWGTHLSAYYPLYNRCVLAIDISANKYMERLEPIKRAANRARVAALIISLLFGLATWYLRNFAKDINDSRILIRDDFKRLSEELN